MEWNARRLGHVGGLTVYAVGFRIFRGVSLLVVLLLFLIVITFLFVFIILVPKARTMSVMHLAVMEAPVRSWSVA